MQHAQGHQQGGAGYVHPYHPVFNEDEYPMRGIVTRIIDDCKMEVRLHRPYKWILPLGTAHQLGLVLDTGGAIPPIRLQTRKIEEAPGSDDPLIVTVHHMAKPVWCYKTAGEDEDNAASMKPEEACEMVRVQHANVELMGLIDEPIRPPIEQTPAEVLQTLLEYTLMFGAGPVDGDAEDGGGPSLPVLEPLNCFQLLDTGLSITENPDGLGPTSTPAQLKDAVTVIMSFLSVLEAKGRQYGVLGNGSAAAIRRTTDFQRTLHRMQLAYGAALSIVALRAAQAPDYDVSRVSYGGYSVVEAPPPPSARGGALSAPRIKTEVYLMDKLLQYCALNTLRHVKNVVYIEQCVPSNLNFTWRAATCARCLEHSMHVMYTLRDTQEHLCIDHALEEVASTGNIDGVVNTVFQCAANYGGNRVSPPGMRMATASNPKWLLSPRCQPARTGTKTWVPDMGAPADGEDIMGADQPETTLDLVRRVLDRRMFDRDTWTMFMGQRGISEHLATHLAKSIDPAFPEHHPKTQLFAFANGLYSVTDNKFRPYDKVPSTWAGAGAINFISEFFDPLWTVQPLDTLAVPGYDDILRTQNYEADTVAFLDAFLGRQLFRLGVLDKWGLAPVLLGTAGSGKSTIAKALMMLVREQNVGQLPSNCEEQYAVASLVGKIMVMCTEMKEGFKLPLNVLQCMITGDPVSVHAKYKDVFDKSSWDSHVLMVGNVIPASWRADQGGAMERRAVVFRLDTKPATQDPTIQTRFFQNLGPFLVRITRTYKDLAARVNAAHEHGRFIKDFVPRQVASFHAMFKSETSISAAFMDHLLSSSFDIGFTNALPPIVLTQDDQLMELYRYMRDAVVPSARGNLPRFPGITFGQKVIELKVDEVVPGATMTQAQFQVKVKEMRVTLKDLNHNFTNWWKDTKPGGPPGTSKPPLLATILAELGLIKTTDALHHPANEQFVFGIHRRANSADDANLLDAMMG